MLQTIMVIQSGHKVQDNGWLYIYRKTDQSNDTTYFSIGIIPAEIDQSDGSDFAWWTLDSLSNWVAPPLLLLHGGSNHQEIGGLIPVKKNDRIKIFRKRTRTVQQFIENYIDDSELNMPDSLIFYPFLKKLK